MAAAECWCEFAVLDLGTNACGGCQRSKDRSLVLKQSSHNEVSDGKLSSFPRQQLLIRPFIPTYET